MSKHTRYIPIPPRMQPLVSVRFSYVEPDGTWHLVVGDQFNGENTITIPSWRRK